MNNGMVTMKKPMSRPGITLYSDILAPILECCEPAEIGTLIIALFQYEQGEDVPPTIFKDKMLRLAFQTLTASSARDEEAYRKKCCTNSVVALYRKWKAGRKEDNLSVDKDLFQGECLDDINEIRAKYNYFGDINLNVLK